MNKRILLYFWWICMPFIGFAQTISGKIVGDEQQAISFANVILLSLPDSVFVQGVITNEQGLFVFERADIKDKIIQISYLGYETITLPCDKNIMGTLVLHSTAIMLQEAVVTAIRPVHQLKNGNLITDVAHSPLSKEHHAFDMLKKIPGMTISKGKLEVFGVGEPIVYINNKKVSSKDEIAMLDPKNIKEVELITNPGAKYDAAGKAVLLITTLNQEDGWMGKVSLSGTQSRQFSNEESVGITYKKKGVTVAGLYNVGDNKTRSIQDFEYYLQEGNKQWNYIDKLRSSYQVRSHYYQFSLDYSVNKNHGLGVQYNGTSSSLKSNATDMQYVLMNEDSFADVSSVSKYNVKRDMHHLNLFYSGKLTKKLELDINVDYVKNENDQNQWVNEMNENENNEVNIDTKTDNQLYAVKAEMNYTFGVAGKLSVGAELNKIDVEGVLRNPDNAVRNTDFTNQENKQAGYLTYDVTLANFGVNVGLRYEAVKSEMKDLLDAKNNISRNYKDWFPNLSLSASLGQTRSSLSYSVRTVRPPFSRLNSNTYYTNQFMIQLGNPQLRPQQSHNVQAMFNYKILNVRMTYSYIKDYMNSVLESDGNTMISSWKNYEKAQMFRANVSLTKTFGWWNTTLAGGLSAPFFDIEYQGSNYSNNTPTVYAQTNNYLSFPRKFVFTIDYMYNNGGSVGIYKFRPYHSFNVGVQKSLFKERLNISLNANDIFQTMIQVYDSRMGHIRFHQREDQDERNFSISIIYRLNNIKSKYRGTGAANEEIRRL